MSFISAAITANEVNGKLKKLITLQDRIIADTLNDVAFYAKNRVNKHLKEDFHNVIKFTLSGAFVKKATEDRAQADLIIQPERSKYLINLINGGERADKGHEKWLKMTGLLPDDMHTVAIDKDPAGNLKGGGGKYTQILSALNSGDPYQWSKDKTKKNKYAIMQNKKTKKPYAVGQLVRVKTKTNKYGGTSSTPVYEPILLFINKARYQANMFKFEEIVETTFDKYIDKAYKQANEKNLGELPW